MTMAQTKKSFEGDVIELLEDLPKYGILKGQRGVIINKFDKQNEAYDIAIEDGDGEFVAFAYSVKSDQFKNITRDLFEQGINLLNQGNFEEAESPFRKAIDLNPTLIGVLHNSILHSFGDSADYGRLITGLKFVLKLNPDYEVARVNLAIAFRKYGIQAAESGDVAQADTYFQMSLFVSSEQENILAVQHNYATMLTKQGLMAHKSNEPEKSYWLMKQAFLFAPSELTKANFGKSILSLAFKFTAEKRYEEAEGLFKGAMLTGLETPSLFNDYGIALAGLGRFDEAIEMFLRALTLAPNDGIIAHNLSLAKLESNEPQSFTQERVDLVFESPLPSEVAGFQVEQLPPQAPQYTLLAA